ncbi:MAG TPA: hypothetical protein P5052_02030 [Candidatus Paceibacterota bacterium]|nr:hypothetical protein [Candidatus Paceibacterota bacterium]HRZ29532.1 hypothetical protein [Candidatus Paceibacterota bacterium]
MKKIIENYKKTFENLPEKEKQERQGIYERVMENTKAALKGFGLEALKHNMPEIAQDILEYTGLLKNSPLIGKQLEKRIKRNEIKKEQAAKEKRNDELEHAGLLGRGAYRILTGKESKEQVPSYILSTSKEILYYGNDLSFSKNTPPVKTPENYVNAIQTEIQEGKKRLETAANKKYVNEIIEEAIGSLKEFGSEAKKYGDENIYNLVKKVLESEGLN